MAVIEELQIVIDAKTTQAVKNLKKVSKGMDDTGKKSNKMGDIFKKLAGPLALGAVVAGAIRLGKAFSTAASDAAEIGSKYATIFRDISGDAEQVASTFAKSFGLAGSTAKELLGNTADLLTGLGFTQEGALDLSEQVNTLAADLASFSNFAGGTAGASEALTKALLGEAESAKALGIVINQNTKEYKDAIKFYTEVEGKTLLQAKAFTALQFATEQSGNAIGDVARTFESHANVTRRLEESTKALKEELGESVNKGLTPMLVTIDSLVKGMANWLAKTNEANDFINDMANGVDVSTRSIEELNLVIEAGTDAAAQMSKGFGDSFTQALIDAGLEAQALADKIAITTALELRYADAIAEGNAAKAAAAQFSLDKDTAEAASLIRLEELRIAGLSTRERELELIQEEINELFKFREVPEIMRLINELAIQRNELLKEEKESVDEVAKASDFMFDNGMVKAQARNEIIEEEIVLVKELNQTYVDLAKVGLGAFAQAFEDVGAGNITLWEGFKQAGKDAVSALLKSLAEMAIVQAAISAAGFNFVSAGLYTAAAGAGYAAAGAVQGFATGTSGFIANQPTMIMTGEGAQSEKVTVEPLSGNSGGGNDMMILNVDGEQFTGWIQRQLNNRQLQVPTGSVVG